MAEDAGTRAEMALLVFVDLAESAGVWTTMRRTKPLQDAT